MKTATTHPTPPPVVDAIHVVAAWLREIGAAEAVIAPEGGAAFHPTRKAEEVLAAWQADRTALLRIALAAWQLSEEIGEFNAVVSDLGTDVLDTQLYEAFGGDWQAIGARIREELGP